MITNMVEVANNDKQNSNKLNNTVICIQNALYMARAGQTVQTRETV